MTGCVTRPLPLNMAEAIAAHRAAWQAFQDAPDGKPAERAEDELQFASYRLAAMPARSADDVASLVKHLDWYTAEEAEQAEPVLVALRTVILWASGVGS